jgi:SAM-dependent methyltransferase
MPVARPQARSRPSLRFVPGRASRHEELLLLRRLWDEQRAHAQRRPPADPDGMLYLAAHFSMDLTIQRHLRVLDGLMPYIRGRVLEWGCRHALDSCIYRHRLGTVVELHGCDVCDGRDYAPFHDFSGIAYRRLDHPWRLDYADASFDVVTSNGVLEHVPDDAASIAEIGRVLRPGGIFAITCLPNRFSYTEAIQRLRGGTAHDRLYTQAGTRRMLQAAGFQVIQARRLLMLPTRLNGFPRPVKAAYQRAGGLIGTASALLERLWPVNLLASNLMLIARKPGDQP